MTGTIYIELLDIYVRIKKQLLRYEHIKTEMFQYLFFIIGIQHVRSRSSYELTEVCEGISTDVCNICRQLSLAELTLKDFFLFF